MTAAPARIETTETAQADEIRLGRAFPAAREAVFRAWTDPRRLADWWGRHDFTNPVCEFDARAGGRLRIVMRSAEGVDYPLLGTVREIKPPSRLALTFDLSAYPDDWRDAICADLAAEDAVLVNEQHLHIDFAESGAGTRLDLRIRFASPTLREVFLRCGILEGWNEGFDSLAALLTRST